MRGKDRLVAGAIVFGLAVSIPACMRPLQDAPPPIDPRAQLPPGSLSTPSPLPTLDIEGSVSHEPKEEIWQPYDHEEKIFFEGCIVPITVLATPMIITVDGVQTKIVRFMISDGNTVVSGDRGYNDPAPLLFSQGAQCVVMVGLDVANSNPNQDIPPRTIWSIVNNE